MSSNTGAHAPYGGDKGEAPDDDEDAGHADDAEGASPPAGAAQVAPVPLASSCCRISLPTSSNTPSITSCDRATAGNVAF